MPLKITIDTNCILTLEYFKIQVENEKRQEILSFNKLIFNDLYKTLYKTI
ncbi:hypothetical protein CFB3_06100 [Clostridium folliculivorans]|uniref:Uncharacterized protein n=1 Tax=Clostridium folliculivorans TaxID=2886038 RepID=A0A9W5Y2Y4_9CLOT|nr:hypothetical protein CFOLD11_23080 [Clostridium folliculivorans]GKU28504.1 hypothetical protein CFB3_06100 [Clostridium folliculivorans]